jgi:hypothetical protein
MPTGIKLFAVATKQIVGGGSLRKRLANHVIVSSTLDERNDLVYLATSANEIWVYNLSEFEKPRYVEELGIVFSSEDPLLSIEY